MIAHFFALCAHAPLLHSPQRMAVAGNSPQMLRRVHVWAMAVPGEVPAAARFCPLRVKCL